MKAEQLYEQITEDLCAAIEAGAGQWSMPWRALATGRSVNVAGRAYRGINALWLPMVADEKGYSSGVWGTYQAWQGYGGQVRKGERATHAVLWKSVPKPRGAGDAGGDAGDTDDAKRKDVLMVRTFAVFAAEQIDGAEARIAAMTPEPLPEGERIEHAEAFFAGVGADVRHGGDRAYYLPSHDYIALPERGAFRTPEHYYGTAAHEHIHWTGHDTRLARDLTGRFGGDRYAMEELVAEIGAAFVGGMLGTGVATRDDHAAYLSSWLRVLKSDARAIQTVASKAQVAADYLAEVAGVAGVAEVAGAAGVAGVAA